MHLQNQSRPAPAGTATPEDAGRWVSEFERIFLMTAARIRGEPVPVRWASRNGHPGAAR